MMMMTKPESNVNLYPSALTADTPLTAHMSPYSKPALLKHKNACRP